MSFEQLRAKTVKQNFSLSSFIGDTLGKDMALSDLRTSKVVA